MLGAQRTPDPTTSGDFLRRFVPAGKLEALRGTVDEIQNRVWNDPKRWNWRQRRRSKEKRPVAVLYLDGKTKEHTGVTKEGADFDYKGRYSYSVLVASLDDGECVALRLRPGNMRSSEGAAELLDEELPPLRVRFRVRQLVTSGAEATGPAKTVDVDQTAPGPHRAAPSTSVDVGTSLRFWEGHGHLNRARVGARASRWRGPAGQAGISARPGARR